MPGRRVPLDLRGLVAHEDFLRFDGAVAHDPARLLEGSGKRMRHVKVRPGRAVDEAALQALLDAAYRDVRKRLGRKP